MPLAGGTFTGAVHLATGATIVGNVRNVISGVELKDTAIGFFDVGNVSGAVTISYTNGSWQRMTAVGGITSVVITNVPATGRVSRMWLQIHQDATGGRTIALGSTFLYPGGTLPTLGTSPNTITVFDVASSDGGASWLVMGTNTNYGAAAYAPNAVIFGGSTYLVHTGPVAGAVNTTDFTFAFAIKMLGADADQHIISIGINGANPSLIVGRKLDRSIYVYGANGTTPNYQWNTSALTLNTWYTVIGSASGTQHQIYINDASNVTLTVHNNVARQFASASANVVGSYFDPPGSAFSLNAEIADLWFDMGRFTDLSVATTRRKFFTATNQLVYKGGTGQLPFGTAPTWYFSGSTASWATNFGTGGGLPLAGAPLTTSSSPPPGA